MKAIVIYKSNTGFTERYAEWIAEALSCKALPVEKIKKIDLNVYDTCVFGGWLFAGSLQGFKEIKEKLIAFKGKKAVFVVGATPPELPEATQNANACFSEEERRTIGTFYMQGGLDYAKMGMIHKGMMKMLCTVMKKQKDENSVEYKAYKTISQSFDAANKAAITPLIDYLTMN